VHKTHFVEIRAGWVYPEEAKIIFESFFGKSIFMSGPFSFSHRPSEDNSGEGPEAFESETFEMEMTFDHFFTLDEAVQMIPKVRQDFEQVHKELGAVRDEIVLYQRFQLQRERTRQVQSAEEEAVLIQKWQRYQDLFNKWVKHFLDQGIVVRDLDRGLIDFPYLSKLGEPFFLCWQLEDDGLFYFHDLEEGFGGRKPISLLPE
jgi:hypothetical protein